MNVIHYFTRGFVSTIFKGINSENTPFHNLPPNMTRYFNWQTVFDYKKPHKASLRVKTIFQELIENNINYKVIFSHRFVDEYLNNSIFRTKVNKAAIKDNSDFLFIIAGDGDYYGHRFGPEHKITMDKLYVLLRILMRIIRYGKFDNIIIFGDHGMSPVKGILDVTQLIRILMNELVLGLDFLMFIDSTMIRFWTFNQSKKDIIKEKIIEATRRLFNEKIGIIDERNAPLYDVPIPTLFYGDIVIFAKGGYIFYPSFWLPYNKSKLKGSHGYESEYEYSMAALLTNINLPRKLIEIADVANVIRKVSGMI